MFPHLGIDFPVDRVAALLAPEDFSWMSGSGASHQNEVRRELKHIIVVLKIQVSIRQRTS